MHLAKPFYALQDSSKQSLGAIFQKIGEKSSTKEVCSSRVAEVLGVYTCCLTVIVHAGFDGPVALHARTP